MEQQQAIQARHMASPAVGLAPDPFDEVRQAFTTLLALAETDRSPWVRPIARFIAATYNGEAFPLDLGALRSLPEEPRRAADICLRAFSCGDTDLHDLVPEGRNRVLRVIRDWGLPWPDHYLGALGRTDPQRTPQQHGRVTVSWDEMNFSAVTSQLMVSPYYTDEVVQSHLDIRYSDAEAFVIGRIRSALSKARVRAELVNRSLTVLPLCRSVWAIADFGDGHTDGSDTVRFFDQPTPRARTARVQRSIEVVLPATTNWEARMALTLVTSMHQ